MCGSAGVLFVWVRQARPSTGKPHTLRTIIDRKKKMGWVLTDMVHLPPGAHSTL